MRERRNTPIRIADARGTLREACSPLGADDRFIEYSILPGFTDVHVHLREPGFLYKETIATGTQAAASGGFVHILTMPNLDPVPDSPAHLRVQTDIIDRDACIDVRPLGSLTRDEKGREVSDIEALAPLVAGFSDDGVGVMDDGLMREAMERVKAAGSIVAAHCEDTRYPRESREAEYRQLLRDLQLAEQTGCPYHMCHVSTRDSVALIRSAKKAGLDVTCETAPHYLTIADDEIADDGRFKMNPPIRSADDRDALREGLADGTIDMIATDHAPHSAEEKSRGILDSAFGIVVLETAFPVLYSRLVCRDRLITTEKLIDLMALAPRRRFPLPGGPITDGARADVTVIDPEASFVINPSGFRSKGKATPFEGWEVQGKVQMTFCAGTPVYEVEQ